MHPPRSETELLQRARDLAGLTLGCLAARLHRPVPDDPRRAKGWSGELIERALGAHAGSAPEPDFAVLGVELKTIPVDRHGRPRESTHVCTVPMTAHAGLTWETSLVRRKLARVLWVPVEAKPAIAIAGRRIGQAILWSPDPAQEAQLRTDWEELMEMVALGRVAEITGGHGTCLQIRPKAADGRVRAAAIDARGETGVALPRGFYLRPTFTAAILRTAYALP